MSPLLWRDAPGTLGRCGKHRRDLVRRKPADLTEQMASERAAADAQRWLAEDGGEADRPPIPTQSPRRRGDCPQCADEIAAAAVAYLNGAEQ